jgi:4-hydroxyphenylpyruvate dioxygenase
MSNPIGLNGIKFVEFSSSSPERMREIFYDFGFSKIMKHKSSNIELYQQNQIYLILNMESNSFAGEFQKSHGPCVSSMGWATSSSTAQKDAIARGAKNPGRSDYFYKSGKPVPTISGIGDSLIYFVPDTSESFFTDIGFEKEEKKVTGKGFVLIDHLTNNVYKGTMEKWSNFYKQIFNFQEIRYFDIRGKKTGLTSYALQSPCKKFSIPINEASEKKSQINEYLDEYKGPGVQHIAFLTDNIVDSLKSMQDTSIPTLSIDEQYYDTVFDRVKGVSENKKTLQDLNILVDGDNEGYLLQIFTKNIVGPIFIEMIQRKNHYAFGEGNFSALFRAIEKDQEERGFL